MSRMIGRLFHPKGLHNFADICLPAIMFQPIFRKAADTREQGAALCSKLNLTLCGLLQWHKDVVTTARSIMLFLGQPLPGYPRIW